MTGVKIACAALACALCAASGPAAPAGFRKVSPHVYFRQAGPGLWNTGAVVTREGVLLVDPPAEAEIPAMLASLKSVTARPVRWVVSTDYQAANAAGLGLFAGQGAIVLCSKELDRLAGSVPLGDPSQPAVPRPHPRFVFSRQVQLQPEAVEIRLLGLRHKARTAGDVIVYLPGDKVLLVGNFFVPGGFPAIDAGHGEGSASGWIDGLKEVIDSVPLLKSAMPQARQEPSVAKPGEPEKSAEDLVAVISSSGEPATLQNMKDLLAAAQKLRSQAARSGRAVEDFLKSMASDSLSQYANFESFAAQLYADLRKK